MEKNQPTERDSETAQTTESVREEVKQHNLIPWVQDTQEMLNLFNRRKKDG